MLDPQRLVHQLHLDYVKILSSHGQGYWFPMAIIVCAVIFLLVGLSRYVEITALAFKPVRQTALVVAHVLGSVLFSLSMALLGVDVTQTLTPVIALFLFSSLAILLPLHIYIALIRRVRERGASAP